MFFVLYTNSRCSIILVINIIIYLFVRIFYYYNIKKCKKYFTYYKIRYVLYESERKNTLLYFKKQAALTIKPDIVLQFAKNVIDIDRSR